MKIYAVVIGKMRGPLSTVLQNAPFCIAKRTVLERKTHRFGMQNAPFWKTPQFALEFDKPFMPSQ